MVMKGGAMRLFVGLTLVVLVGIAIFAVQNSTAPTIDLKFFVWDIRTSLVYTILATFASGMVAVFLLWIPSALRVSSQKRSLKKEIEILEKERRQDAEASRQRDRDNENEA
jgi:uncharacterized integral membrane protein